MKRDAPPTGNIPPDDAGDPIGCVTTSFTFSPVLEQRTGRVDRIGSKAERCGQPIRVYLPYLAETQDEKQYRVVMDRERWFSVVMGEKFKVDARSTEKLARRIPLPESVAEELAFRLAVR